MVPRVTPATVASSVAPVVFEPAKPGVSFASPKSSSFTWPLSVRKMFPGLMSRWMMPSLCVVCSASAISMPMSTIWWTFSGPRASRSRRLSPFISSITMKGRPSSSPTS